MKKCKHPQCITKLNSFNKTNYCLVHNIGGFTGNKHKPNHIYSEKNCKVCDKLFEPTTGAQITCCINCKVENYNNRNRSENKRKYYLNKKQV